MERWVKLACHVAVCGFICWTLYCVADLTRAQKGVVQQESQKTRDLIQAEINTGVTQVSKVVNDLANKLDLRVVSIQHDVIHVASKNLENANKVLAGTLGNLSGGIKPILSNAAQISALAKNDMIDSRGAIEAAFKPADIAGVVRDARLLLARGDRAAGSFEHAMVSMEATAKDFQGAVPQILVSLHDIEVNSDRTTAATARVMGNLAAETKPLPAWARIPLSITGSLAPTVAGAVSAAAATGAFR